MTSTNFFKAANNTNQKFFVTGTNQNSDHLRSSSAYDQKKVHGNYSPSNKFKVAINTNTEDNKNKTNTDFFNKFKAKHSFSTFNDNVFKYNA